MADRLTSSTSSTNNSSIYNFGAALNASVRPSQFRISINIPTEVINLISQLGDNAPSADELSTRINFLTHQAQLPNYVTQDCQLYYRGRPYHESGEREYQQWNCTIYNSGDFMVRTAIERWVELMHSTNIVWGETRPEVYKGSVTIEQLDRKDNVLRVYKLIGAWPSDTGTVELSFQNGSEVETFAPTFIYDYFLVGKSVDQLLRYDSLAYSQATSTDTSGNASLGGMRR